MDTVHSPFAPIEYTGGFTGEAENGMSDFSAQIRAEDDRQAAEEAWARGDRKTAEEIVANNPYVGIIKRENGVETSKWGAEAASFLGGLDRKITKGQLVLQPAGHVEVSYQIDDPAGGEPQNTESLPCPPPAGQAPHQATRRLGHYREGSGKPIHMPIREINAPFPVPTAFPQIAKLVNQGTGQPFVQYEINNAHSDPIATSGQQSAYLGRITFTLSGILNVYMTGHYQFYGTIGVVDDLFDFNAETSSHKRTRFGELTVTVARQLSGKPFYNIIDGHYQVSYEGGPSGVTLSDCR
jgi:hypothetical protein